MQSVFALDTAGVAARATIKHFESRHPQVRTDAVDAGATGSSEEQREYFHGDVDIKIEDESREDAMVGTAGVRKSKRRRTRVAE